MNLHLEFRGWSRNRTGENNIREPRPLERPLSWALPWTPSWDVSWELSWGVFEGLQPGKINPRGCCRGRSRGRSYGSTRGPPEVRFRLLCASPSGARGRFCRWQSFSMGSGCRHCPGPLAPMQHLGPPEATGRRTNAWAALHCDINGIHTFKLRWVRLKILPQPENCHVALLN